VEASDRKYPVFDLISRVADETKLTRKTVRKIFECLSVKQKGYLFSNPEGWCRVFLEAIKNVLCQHIANQIVFTIDPAQLVYDSEELFPQSRAMPQRELIPAGKRGLYNKVQVDSDVERFFVQKSISRKEEYVVLYFKFPPKFKIPMPKVIGNYNPDWGIVYKGDDGKLNLQLVRETKGTEDIEQLQFSSEKFKILCAKRFFEALGISYRVVTDKTLRWWEEAGYKHEGGLFLKVQP